MSKCLALQIDPLESLNYSIDSSYRLGLEGQNRGFQVYCYSPKDLFFDQKKLFAHAKKVHFSKNITKPYDIVEVGVIDLSQMDIIFLRQDPPFDMAYITSTYLLELLGSNVLILNDSKGVRDTTEKLSILKFPHLTAPTTIAYHIDDVLAFQEMHGDIVLKPLYGRGGESVYYFKQKDNNIKALISHYQQLSSIPFMIQKFIPDVSKGDKRILLLDGEPIGAIMRKPKQGEFRANLHVGGTCVKTDLTPQDLFICKEISQFLKDNGLFFVGIDVIGSYLSEINVTSPTCIQQINDANNVYLEAIIWDKIEEKLKKL